MLMEVRQHRGSNGKEKAQHHGPWVGGSVYIQGHAGEWPLT